MLEDTFTKIDKIINEIENLNSANDFEESIKLYKEGIEIINLCKKYIKEISLKKDNENQNLNEINLNITINKIEKDLNSINNITSFKKLKEIYKKIINCQEKINSDILKVNEIIIKDNNYDINSFN